MKKFIAIFSALIMITALTVGAAASDKLLCDNSGILSSDEAQSLSQRLNEVSESCDMDVVIVTTDSSDGKTSRDYADDYYDQNGYGRGEANSGILLLVNFEESDVWISTAGDAIYIFTDAGIEAMLDNIVPYLSDGDWYGGFNEYISLCEDYYIHAKEGSPYDTDDMPKEENGFDMANLLVPIGIGIAAGFITTGAMKSKLKSVHFETRANNYIKSGSYELTHERDIFLYSTVTKTPKPQDNNRSGGSSIHTSSGGVSHGGGGRGF